MMVVRAAADLTELLYFCGHPALVVSGEAATCGSRGIQGSGWDMGGGSPVPGLGRVPAGLPHSAPSGRPPDSLSRPFPPCLIPFMNPAPLRVQHLPLGDLKLEEGVLL